MQNSRFKLRFVCPLLAITCLGFSSCSQDDRPLGVPVSGVVTYRGEPLEGADVAFSSEQPETASGFGRTDAQGHFQLTSRETREGIPPGSYRVKITKVSVESEWDPEWDEGVRPKQVEQVGLPARYGDYETSGLSETVTEDGPNEFRFNLTD